MTAAVARPGHNPNADRTQPVSLPDAPFVPPPTLYRVVTDLPPVPVALGSTTPPWTRTAWAGELENAAPRQGHRRLVVLLIVTTVAILAAAALYARFAL